MLRDSNEWGWTLPSVTDGTQPSATIGTAVTPAVGSYGSYAQLISGANLTYDVWEIDILVHSVRANATARDAMVSLGVDPAGGTSYTSVADLLVGPTYSYVNQAGGSFFRFPYRIAAGSSIGIAGATSAGVTAFRAMCTVRGLPDRPWRVRAGTYIETLGATLPAGTSITPGTAANGTYVSLGSPTKPCWHWNFGYSIANATMATQVLAVDLAIGDASNKKTIIGKALVQTGTDEGLSKPFAVGFGKATTADIIYARAQSSATPESGHTVAAYGIGG